jgi:cell filamentation protein
LNHVRWRWNERDFGLRFRAGAGKAKAEYYEGREPGTYYTVPAKLRKLDKRRADNLIAVASVPISPRVVPSPWRHYDKSWDWITTEDGILLNFAGCLEREEIDRREDEGVARAMELVATLLEAPEPVSLTSELLRRIHVELMGSIYPFAGQWRAVGLHKGDGPEKWPLPPGGMEPLINIFERDVLSRSPVLAENDEDVFRYVGEVMCEMLALHPFREGNGRTAFIIGNLLLMQTGLLPLSVYDRRNDQARYYDACEAGRVRKDYQPLAGLVAEWQEAARARWEAQGGD